MPPLSDYSGAGCGNRTHFVSLKRRVHIHICQSRESGGGRWNRTSLVSLKRRVHLSSLPVTHVQHQNGAGCWNRTNASRLSTAGSTFELILQNQNGAPFGS